MKLFSISNIGWEAKDDPIVYEMMKQQGFQGLELAPTRIIAEQPYSHPEQIAEWSHEVCVKHGFTVSSLQSIWYGRQENLFASCVERQALADYTRQAIDFAAVLQCRNLVFGCPKNRNRPEGADEQQAITFLKEIGDYAAQRGTIIGIEANPPIYQTNLINDTKTALEWVLQINSPGCRLTLDVGTMIEQGEDPSLLKGKVHLINHVHVSEPYLKPIRERSLHTDLHRILREEGYQRYISIEVGKIKNLSLLEEMMRYVRGIFS
ncbi:MAG: sugar phosphate isomerase/epimerase family protein [Lachnospiraceae bacterium]|nr:sugar phosphate isomerase/epimerase [Lachnospiraceae bacterium]MDY5743026.1 sugar phosphate isomerase/epimerase family protein [Lachnospiraceae bacterium]